MTHPRPAPLNPFPGLRPFREDEEHLFFGREGQIDRMVDKLAANRFLAVLGTSGSGKSSLVNCGLRPALHRGLMAQAGTRWRMAQFRPGHEPIRSLALALAQDGVLFAGSRPGRLPREQIIEDDLRMSKLGIVDVYGQARLGERVNLLVVADQFEELFRFRSTIPPSQWEHDAAGEAVAFVNLLLEAARQRRYPIYVVLTMRCDFMGDSAQFPGLAEAVNEGQYLVPRLSRDERREAIAGPIGVFGGLISPVLLTRLVNDVGDNPDQLSILQHALNRTWAYWQHDGAGSGPLAIEHYEAIGGMARALDQHAEKAYHELATEQHQRICERIFKTLTDMGTDARGIRRPTTFGSLCAITGTAEEDVAAVIDVFRKPSRSFLMPPLREPLRAETVVDISHESLMRVWTRLNRWAHEEAESAGLYRRLADTAQRHAKGEAALWRDPDLQFALDWRKRQTPTAAWAGLYGGDFQTASAFLDASTAERDQRVREEQEAREREMAARTAAIERKRKAVLWMLGAAIVLSAVFGWLLLNNRKLLLETLAGRLATESALLQAQRDSSLDTSLLLALESMLRVPLVLSDEVAHASLQLLPRQLIRKKYADKVLAVAFSPDGNFVASGSEDGSARVMDIATGAEVPFAAKGSVAALAFSPDGRYVATGGYDQMLRVWEAKTGKELWSLPHGGDINVVAYSPDGSRLATGSSDGVARVVDSSTGEEIARLKHGQPASSRSPQNAAPQDSRVVAVAFSPDGKYVATVSWDHTARLMTAATGKQVWQVTQGDHVYSVVFSRDGHLLATGSSDGTVRVLDAASGREISRLQEEKAIFQVAFSPDSRFVATASGDGTARIVDAATGKPMHVLKHQDQVTAVAYYPDGRHLATGSDDGTARVFDAATGQEVSRLPHESYVRTISVSPDGRRLATGSADGSVRVAEETTGKSLFHASAFTSIRAAALSSSGRYLALGGILSGRQQFQVVDVSANRVAIDFPGEEEVNDAAFDPSNRLAAWGGSGRKARVADVLTGQVIATVPHPEEIYAVALSADGRYLAAGGDGGTVLVTESATGRETMRFAHKNRVVAVAFSPDGRLVATGSQDKTAAVVEIFSHKELLRYVDRDQVNGVAFSPDSRFVAAGGWDGTLHVIETASGREVFRHHDPSAITFLAYSPDGRYIATAGEDKTVRVVEATGREVSIIRHGDPVLAVRYLPAGANALQTFAGAMLFRHPLQEELMRQACAHLTRNLTREEWSQYFPESSYRRTCPDLP